MFDFDFLEKFNLWQIPDIFAGLACYFVQLALILFAIFVIYSGIKFILSRGNPEAYSQARKTFVYSLIGGVIIYLVYTIILTLASIFGIISLPWVPLSCS